MDKLVDTLGDTLGDKLGDKLGDEHVEDLVELVIKLVADYDYKFNEHNDKLSYSQYIFDVAKCCGYSEFVTAYKDSTTADLYKMIMMQFENKHVQNVYVISSFATFSEKILIPKSDTLSIREFYNMHRDSMRPKYPMPCKLVYQLYYDDGTFHDHSL